MRFAHASFLRRTQILNIAQQRMAAARVGRLLLQASNAISRQPVPTEIGKFLSCTPEILCGARCAISAKQFSTHRQDDSTSGKTVFRPRRTLMYVPASDERKTKKAASLRVDTIVFDLEDGVAANQKVCQLPSLVARCICNWGGTCMRERLSKSIKECL